MQENWPVLLKYQIIDQYVCNPQDWVDVNISTSGLLNLTIVSDRFISLPIFQRKEQICNLIQSQVPHLSPGFLSLYTHQEAESLNLSPPQVFNPTSIHTWQDLAIQAANPQNETIPLQQETSYRELLPFILLKEG